MARRATYIVVEGPHDTAFVGKLLRETLGLKTVSRLAEVDSIWNVLIPRTYPPVNPGTTEEEFKRVKVPEFFQDATTTVAVEWAEGINQVATVLTDSLAVLPSVPDSVGLVVDADSAAAAVIFDQLTRAVSAARPGFKIGPAPGQIAAGPPRAGVFVMPDNASVGTLEDLLLDCATVAYPSLKPLAETYVNSATALTLPRGEDKELNKPSGRKKAVVSAVSSILKPGKAAPNTIRDNSWIQPATLALQRIAAMASFLENLAR